MSERKTVGEWIRANWLAIAMPLVSGAIALVVAYGSFQRDNATMLSRISALEASISKQENQNDDYDDQFDEIEDAFQDGDRDLENLVITEGRNLERKIIRLEGRVDSINRRITFIDGIGAGMLSPPALMLDGIESPLILPGEE